MKQTILIICLLVLIFNVNSQSVRNGDKIDIGKPIPAFTLANLKYYLKKSVSSNDLKGQWYILDLWSKWCSACLKSLPENNKLQQQYQDRIQIILVGLQDRENQIQPLYEKFRTKLNLNFPVVFDSTIFAKWDVKAVPFIIVVDPKGVVRGLTYKLSAELIESLLSETTQFLPNLSEKVEYNTQLPLLTYNNGGSDTSYLFRSLLTQWKYTMPVGEPAEIYQGKPSFEGFRLTVEQLYCMAYMGRDKIRDADSLDGLRLYSSIINEVNDKFLVGFDSERNLYSYSLSVPSAKANRKYMMQVMQTDLKNYFGYVVAFETREMPYWSVVASEKAKMKLKTKGGNWEKSTSSHAGFNFINSPPSSIISFLTSYNPSEPPFIDETSIKGNIDIKVDALLTDFNDFRKGLEANGLFLVKKEKEMKVLVIRDPKPE